MRLLDAAGTMELPRTTAADHLAHDGIVLIRQGSLDEIRKLLSGWTEPVRHPHETQRGLTILTPNGSYDETIGMTGFTRAALAPHTDRSLQPEPPSVVAAMLVSPAVTGGHALLADGARVLATLRHSFSPAAIAGLRLCVTGRPAVPIIARVEGLVRIRYRDDPLAFPCADHGNRRIIAALRDAVLAETTTISLERGDGYLVHNHRYLHGRTSFSGHRRLARLLARTTSPSLSWLNHGFPVAFP